MPKDSPKTKLASAIQRLGTSWTSDAELYMRRVKDTDDGFLDDWRKMTHAIVEINKKIWKQNIGTRRQWDVIVQFCKDRCKPVNKPCQIILDTSATRYKIMCHEPLDDFDTIEIGRFLDQKSWFRFNFNVITQRACSDVIGAECKYTGPQFDLPIDEASRSRWITRRDMPDAIEWYVIALLCACYQEGEANPVFCPDFLKRKSQLWDLMTIIQETTSLRFNKTNVWGKMRQCEYSGFGPSLWSPHNSRVLANTMHDIQAKFKVAIRVFFHRVYLVIPEGCHTLRKLYHQTILDRYDQLCVKCIGGVLDPENNAVMDPAIDAALAFAYDQLDESDPQRKQLELDHPWLLY